MFRQDPIGLYYLCIHFFLKKDILVQVFKLSWYFSIFGINAGQPFFFLISVPSYKCFIYISLYEHACWHWVWSCCPKQSFAWTNLPAHLRSPAIFKPGMTSALYIVLFSSFTQGPLSFVAVKMLRATSQCPLKAAHGIVCALLPGD